MYKYIYFKLIKFKKNIVTNFFLSLEREREAVEMTESALVYICLNK